MKTQGEIIVGEHFPPMLGGNPFVYVRSPRHRLVMQVNSVLLLRTICTGNATIPIGFLRALPYHIATIYVCDIDDADGLLVRPWNNIP